MPRMTKKKANYTNDQNGPRQGRFYCNVKPTTPRVFGPGVSADRASAINSLGDKWVNGTELRQRKRVETKKKGRESFLGTEETFLVGAELVVWYCYLERRPPFTKPRGLWSEKMQGGFLLFAASLFRRADYQRDSARTATLPKFRVALPSQ